MVDEQDAHAVVDDVAQSASERERLGAVESGGWFVEEQQAGPAGQGAGDAGQLALAL